MASNSVNAALTNYAPASAENSTPRDGALTPVVGVTTEVPKVKMCIGFFMGIFIETLACIVVAIIVLSTGCRSTSEIGNFLFYHISGDRYALEHICTEVNTNNATYTAVDTPEQGNITGRFFLVNDDVTISKTSSYLAIPFETDLMIALIIDSVAGVAVSCLGLLQLKPYFSDESNVPDSVIQAFIFIVLYTCAGVMFGVGVAWTVLFGLTNYGVAEYNLITIIAGIIMVILTVQIQVTIKKARSTGNAVSDIARGINYNVSY